MSRQTYLLGVGMLLVTGALVGTDALLWEPGVTAANVRRIRPGMTAREVEAILGKPAVWEYRDALWEGSVQPLEERHQPLGRAAVCWCWLPAADGETVVSFDETGRVDGVKQCLRSQPSPLDRLRAWLGW
jgi:hypothetical protein